MHVSKAIKAFFAFENVRSPTDKSARDDAVFLYEPGELLFRRTNPFGSEF